jgi:hypothetical protein
VGFCGQLIESYYLEQGFSYCPAPKDRRSQVDFVVKSRIGDPARVVSVTEEHIAGQRVGSRLEFPVRQDLTVEFADGSVMIDDIDLIIYIIPNEYFCYRGDDFILKFSLDCRKVQLDQRSAAPSANPHTFIAACSEF